MLVDVAVVTGILAAIISRVPILGKIALLQESNTSIAFFGTFVESIFFTFNFIALY